MGGQEFIVGRGVKGYGANKIKRNYMCLSFTWADWLLSITILTSRVYLGQ